MIYDDIKNLYYQSSDLIDLAYKMGIDQWDELPIINDSDIDDYNKNSNLLNLPLINTSEMDYRNIEEVDSINQQTWFMYETYKKCDVLNFCLSKCSSEKERERVHYEFDKFKEKNMLNILKYMIWLVDIMNDNNIIWGVGRGSSVSSFILYLIGIHCINPLLYNIDCNEFFKEEEEKNGI